MILYSERQIDKIRDASRVTTAVLMTVVRAIVPGITTKELDTVAISEFKRQGATSAFLGYKRPGMSPFPASICTSVNDVVIHGVPDDVPLVAGDVVSIDCGAWKDGYVGDTAYTVVVGNGEFADEKALLAITHEGLWGGIRAVSDKVSIGTVAGYIQQRVERAGYDLVREFCGHGVGGALHEWPNIPNHFNYNETYAKLRRGMVFTIEPMVAFGNAIVKMDGWPVRTVSGRKAAHFEHTIAIKWDGTVDVLTDWEQKT